MFPTVSALAAEWIEIENTSGHLSMGYVSALAAEWIEILDTFTG